MTQSTTPKTPGVPATMNTVWPPSNPSGTVIPFRLPWGQTGCCPPGGMDALMKCYCDLQQASAFIGQVMLDQFANNPAQIEAIIAGIEKSGSNLPLIGVTNGADAQPGQVGEFVSFTQQFNYATGSTPVTPVTLGVLQPGDWDCWMVAEFFTTPITLFVSYLSPAPVGFSNIMSGVMENMSSFNYATVINSPARALTSAPSLIAAAVALDSAAAGSFALQFGARRRR